MMRVMLAGATVIRLERNYRSTAPILDTTNALISRSRERYSKQLWTERTGGEPPWLVTVKDEHAQTAFVVDRLLELHEEGIPLREMAVLFRAGYLSADLEIELANRRIPYEKWGGLKFLEAAHVKDVLAFLRTKNDKVHGLGLPLPAGAFAGVAAPKTAILPHQPWFGFQKNWQGMKGLISAKQGRSPVPRQAFQ